MKFWGIIVAGILAHIALPSAGIAQVPSISGIHYDSLPRVDLETPGIDFWTDTLFSDGTACRNCFEVWASMPQQLADWKRRNPDDVGTWRTLGPDHNITYPDIKKPIEYATSMLMQPVAKDTRLDVVLENAAGSDGVVYPGFFAYIRFTKDGTFGLFSNPTTLIDGGEYRIDGYRIALIFRNGQQKIFSLARDPNDPNFLIINGTGFYSAKTRG